MKIKSLLIAAATLAVGAISSQAQVYSQNVVGYVNVSIAPNAFTCINVPVDYDGTGTNNQVVNVVGTNVPNGTLFEAWTPGVGFVVNTFGPTSKNPTPHWTLPTATYNPGAGIFVLNPSNSPVTLTLAGTVLQGSLTNKAISQAGFALVGGQFPVTGGLTSTFGYVPVNGDLFESYDPTNGFTVNTYGPTSKNPTPHWTTGEPQLGVGQGAFILTTNTAPIMTTNFVIP